MNAAEAVIEGTLNPDGSLELDEKPKLPAGRVTVVLRPLSGPAVRPDDEPFWYRMRAMWAILITVPDAADGGANTLMEVQKLREEWHDHQQAIERLTG